MVRNLRRKPPHQTISEGMMLKTILEYKVLFNFKIAFKLIASLFLLGILDIILLYFYVNFMLIKPQKHNFCIKNI